MVTIEQAYRDTSRGELANIARRLEQEAERIRQILDATALPPSKIDAARHLDTARPGPHHPTLFEERPGNHCSRTDCRNMATHTIDTAAGPLQVCTSCFTEWLNATPL